MNKVRELPETHEVRSFQHKNVIFFSRVDDIQIIFYAKNLEVYVYILYLVMCKMPSNKTSLFIQPKKKRVSQLY